MYLKLMLLWTAQGEIINTIMKRKLCNHEWGSNLNCLVMQMQVQIY